MKILVERKDTRQCGVYDLSKANFVRMVPGRDRTLLVIGYVTEDIISFSDQDWKFYYVGISEGTGTRQVVMNVPDILHKYMES